MAQRVTLLDRLRKLWGPKDNGVGIFQLGQQGYGIYTAMSWDFVRIANSVYGNPTGYRCVEAISLNFSRPAWQMLPQDTVWPQVGDEGKALKNHRLLDVLNHPNPTMSGTMMQRSMARDLELAGKTFWVKMQGLLDSLTIKGPITGLRRLPPQRVTVVGNQDDELLGFVYNDRSGRQVPILPENLVYLRYPHAERIYDGMAPALTAGLAAETDTSSARFNRDLINNDGATPGYLMIPGLTSDQFQKWKVEWELGSQPGKTRFIGGQDAKYVRIGQTNQELTYDALRRDSQDDILRGFGVPRAVAFDTADTTYANAAAEKALFMQQNILAKWILIADELTIQLGAEEGVRITFALEGIDELQDSRDAVVERAIKLLDRQAMTINEFRTGQGWKPVPWGDEPVAPLQPMSARPIQPIGPDPVNPEAGRLPEPATPNGKPTAMPNGKPSGGSK